MIFTILRARNLEIGIPMHLKWTLLDVENNDMEFRDNDSFIENGSKEPLRLLKMDETIFIPNDINSPVNIFFRFFPDELIDCRSNENLFI